jgi:hypothetical protein
MPKVQLTDKQLNSSRSTHTDATKKVSYADPVCPECVASGDSWVE